MWVKVVHISAAMKAAVRRQPVSMLCNDMPQRLCKVVQAFFAQPLKQHMQIPQLGGNGPMIVRRDNCHTVYQYTSGVSVNDFMQQGFRVNHLMLKCQLCAVEMHKFAF